MKVLYIGQFTKGTTSRMRALQIERILSPSTFEVIDTNIPFLELPKILRSIGFQFKKGPLISKLNTYVKNHIHLLFYDLVWIDKGVYIQTSTMELLRQKCGKLVHYTPDMAFYANKSALFVKSLPFYDYCISTKSAEAEAYLKLIPKEKLLMTTQGFEENIHRSHHQFGDKDNAVVFIGLAEPHRFEIAETLLEAGIDLKLVGKKWESFVKRHQHKENFKFLGEAVYDEEYSRLISASKFSLGFLSKNFPEYHTTRTFEILACGTALLTEANPETLAFFEEDEVIFYKDTEELIEKIKYYTTHDEELKQLIQKGHKKVACSGYDYHTILTKLLNKILK